MTAEPMELVLGGAVGAMALVSLLVLSARRRDFVALWLSAFLASLAASLLLGHASTVGQWCAFLALPCLGLFALWQRWCYANGIPPGHGSAA